ncbi:MAG: zinc-binding dehydrogenase [Bacteriovoracaceae bacterium]|nr:zinc-binding dehydrogenase [Bacteriovoracaceae bacterium]
MKTKATFLKNINEPLAYTEELLVPELRPGQVLVELAYAGVCHSQLMEVKGKRGEDKYLPHLLGHEGSGVIRAIGSNISKVKVGDRVVIGWIKGDGIEDSGALYVLDGLKINAGGATCFEQFAVVSENRVTALPSDIPLDVAVLFGCALPTGAGIIFNTIKPEDNSTLVIWGLGGIGLSALIASQLFNCEKVIAIDIEKNKLDLALEIGADVVINAKEVDVEKFIFELYPSGVDYAVEATGKAEIIENTFRLIKKGGGLLVFASHPEHGKMIQLDPFDLICGKNIKGSWGGDSNPDKDIPKYCELYRSNKLPIDKLITNSYDLSEVNAALRDLDNRSVNRALLRINPDLQ